MSSHAEDTGDTAGQCHNLQGQQYDAQQKNDDD